MAIQQRASRAGTTLAAGAPLLWAALGIAAIVLWVGGSGYRQDLMVLSCSYALIGLGMYIPFIMGGSLSAAYSAYAAIGAYVVCIVAVRTGWPLPVAWLIGPLVAGTVAVLLGMATRRLSGNYLVAVTLLFGFAFQTWTIDATAITGGSSGLLGIRKLDIAGWIVSRKEQFIGSMVVVCLVAHVIELLRRSPWGVALRAKREVPLAVESTGIPTPMLELASLGFGAGVAALGGALFSGYNGGIHPETFGLNIIFLAVFMPLVGGVGTPWGAVVGAFLAVQFSLNFPPSISKSGSFAFAIAVMLVLMLAPKGVLGYLAMLRDRLRAALRKRAADRASDRSPGGPV